jgi:hypothetical protein
MAKRLLLVVALAAAAAGVFFWTRTPELSTPASLLARLPSTDATLLCVDFDALRRAGLLDLMSGATADAEPEYKAFLVQTGFDYGRDLDLAYVSFHPAGTFLILRGRFDWPKLEAYAGRTGGACVNHVCRMMGSTPERRISFFALQANVMAMAVSTDDFAASRLAQAPEKAAPIVPPNQPVFLYIPSVNLKKTDAFPVGTQLFAKAVEDTESVSLSLGAGEKAFEANLQVDCRSDQQSAAVLTAFQKITDVLRDILAKEKIAPNPQDLSGVLTSGTFRQENRRVLGRWPIDRAFLEALTGKS